MKTLKAHLTQYNCFTESEIKAIIDDFEPKSFHKKELVANNEVLHYLFFVSKGCIRVFITDYEGKEHNILFGTEGYWVGDLQSFIHRVNLTYQFQAMEDTEVFRISKSKWDNLTTTYPSFLKYISVLYQNAMVAQQKRVVDVLSLPAEERLKNLMQKRPSLINRVPQKEIASYLGITPEFLSQLRKKISQE